jgi:hypothetical protein
MFRAGGSVYGKTVKVIGGVRVSIDVEGGGVTFHALTRKKMERWEASFLQERTEYDPLGYGSFNFTSRKMTPEELVREKVEGVWYISTWQSRSTTGS